MTTKSIIFNLFLLISSISTMFAENKIVYLISPPRCLSTAFLRMMEARGDFTIINEPSLHAGNSNINKDWFYDGTPENFQKIKEKILTASKTSNVFIKDMGFSVKDFLLQDQEFIQNKNVYFIFLIRNPHHSILSLYKKTLNFSQSFSYFASYKHTYDILQHIKEQSPKAPFIICSEDLYENTSETIERFCQHIGIENKKEALHWQSLGNDFTGKEEWNESKHQKITYYWHNDAIQSSCFTTPHTYAIDTNGIPTFEEITNPKDRENCKKAYYENLTYYNLILEGIDHI